MSKSLLILGLFVFSCEAIRPGPEVQATKGEVWPKPQQQEKFQDYYIIRPSSFTFKIPEDIGCPNFLSDAVTRYWDLIDTSATSTRKSRSRSAVENDQLLGYLDTLNIEINEECAAENIIPALHDDENYSITVNADGAVLSAATIWGVLRGLETFSQLIYREQDSLIIKSTTITDFPRFTHRGFLMDTSRHFEPISVILQMLDAMSYNKMNVFHWHLTDDHSFPYKSRTYPELSDEGAYHPVETVYQQSDISKVIEYARLRGIRVIPEFDTPGHTASWGASHPELLTTCYTDQEANGELGPMDPTTDNTYDFISTLFAEVVDLFPDSYFHIGGDEVDFSCWESNPDINAYMTENNIATYQGLEDHFIQHVIGILDNLKSNYLVWQEVFDDGVDLPNSTIVHVWKNNGLTSLFNVVKAGKYGLYSSCWYLSDIHNGGDWSSFYSCEPFALIRDEEHRKLVLGGEACMWGEYVNEFSIIPTVWPRTSAIAERLWSAETVTDEEDAKKRLEEHACRMNKRGIAAKPPNGPGVCL